MKKFTLIALVFFGTVVGAGSVAAQSPVVIRGEGTGDVTGDVVGPVVVKRSAVDTAVTAPPLVAVTTYHYDTLRTGWNNQETTLTATSFPSTFTILTTVTLDDQVDAQPLLVQSKQSLVARMTSFMLRRKTTRSTRSMHPVAPFSSPESLDLPFRHRLNVAIMGRMWELTAPPSSI